MMGSPAFPKTNHTKAWKMVYCGSKTVFSQQLNLTNYITGCPISLWTIFKSGCGIQKIQATATHFSILLKHNYGSLIKSLRDLCDTLYIVNAFYVWSKAIYPLSIRFLCLYSIQVSLLWFWTQCLLYWATCVVWHEKQSIVEQNHFLLLHTMYSNKLHSGYIFQGEAWSLAHGPPWVDGLVNSSPQCS